MPKVIYTETQSMYFVLLLLGGAGIFIGLSTVFQWGSKPIPVIAGIALTIFFLFLCSLLYRMRILITNIEASVSFGIGLIKRKIPFHDLQLESAQIVQLPWYWGIGYRIGPQGTFFNTRPGPALLIKTKSGNTEFFVGTKNGEKILEILKEQTLVS